MRAATPLAAGYVPDWHRGNDMDRTVTAPLFTAPGFKELWIAGGIANAMLWLEVLAAGLFTFQATGSGLAVAIVSAARSFRCW
jgi:hypothetical protein